MHAPPHPHRAARAPGTPAPCGSDAGGSGPLAPRGLGLRQSPGALGLQRRPCKDARLPGRPQRESARGLAQSKSSRTPVAASLPGLKALCNAIFSYLNANPDFVVDTPKIIFTAQCFQDLLGGAASLEPVVTATKVALGLARDARQNDEAALRTNTRGLIDVLATKLDPMSPLWDAFGLNRPGADVTPEAPAAPALSKVAGGNVLAQVPPVPTATYFRWFIQLVGIDPDYRFIGRTDDPTKVIDDLPANGTLKVKVEAANEAGPGTASEVATIALGV